MNACVRCKGKNPRLYCGKEYCPLMNTVKTTKPTFKQDFFGKSPNVFVGRHNYPNVNAGIIGSEFADETHDNPRMWSDKNYQIENILSLRTGLVNSKFSTNIKSFNTKMNDIQKEISMASQPVETEIHLKKKPQPNLKMSSWTPPTGPSALLKRAAITENPKVPIQIERAVSDTDFKAIDAINSLYKKRIDENHLTKLISVGNLGVRMQRKMVPTRWSITTVDDTIGKRLISRIKDNQVSDYHAYFSSYLGNYYLILQFPEVWSYELFETYLPRTAYNNPNVQTMTDYEPYTGRKNYAQETAGGYYAARLAILEHLQKTRRQASVLALRFITDEYYAPLGVWVVRSAVRKTMATTPQIFETKQEMMDYAETIVKKFFIFDIKRLTTKSILLKQMKEQTRLSAYI